MKILLSVIIVNFFLLLLLYCRMKDSLTGIRQLDKNGSLYYGEYVKDHRFFLYSLLLRLLRGGSCSAFYCRNEEGRFCTGRNYDMPHKDEKGEISGLNMVLFMKPRNAYSSINGVDLSWLSLLKLPYYRGCLSFDKTSRFPLALAPYLAMDGINEKGFSASILALDLKKGEKAVCQKEKGKRSVIINQLLRELLDRCADCEEAKEYIASVNLHNFMGYDYHLFLSDAKGESWGVEWRFNRTTFFPCEALTNFYANDDDGEDCYYGKELKEAFHPYRKTERTYRFGYGHGYERFNKLIRKLDRPLEERYQAFNEKEVFQLLGDVAQDFDGSLTSFTQYSVLYDNSAKTADYCLMQDYETHYRFSFDRDLIE